MKIWRPNNCACVIEEIYDGTAIVGGGQVLRKCAAHQTIPDASLYARLNRECHTRADVERALLADQSIAESRMENGEVVRAYKAGVLVRSQFDGVGPDRVLTVTVEGVAPAERTRLSQAVARVMPADRDRVVVTR